MRWQLRFARNALFGLLPPKLQEQARMLKRQVLPRTPEIDPHTLNQAFLQLEMLHRSGCEAAGRSVLEIGTGWQPTIPLVFSLSGARKVTMIDIQRLMDSAALGGTASKLREHSELIARRLSRPVAELSARLDPPAGASFTDLLVRYNLEYLAPFDLLSGDLPAQELDIIISRAVLEHVPPDTVTRIFHECRRILRPGGRMCHLIDNSDHWEHEDKRLTRLHYLKYSQRAFDRISSWNPLDYQNRLRHFQYVEMLQAAGFEILIDDSVVSEEALASLGKIDLDDAFKGMPPRELAILSSRLVVGVTGNEK